MIQSRPILPIFILVLLLISTGSLSAGERSDLIIESFEGVFPPPGWSIMTSGESNTWEQDDTHANSGSHCARVRYGTSGQWQDEWLVTPALDLTSAGMLFLEFFEAEDYWSYGHAHHVAVSTTVPDDPEAFTTAVTWTPGDHAIPPDFNGGGPVVVDLSAFVGYSTVYVALRYEGEAAGNWFVDDLYLYEPQLHDIAVLEILPRDHIPAGSVITPQALVANVGQNSESFDILYEITTSGVPVYANTLGVSDLTPGDEITVDFPPFTTEGDNYYETRATALLPGDQFPDNDILNGDFDTYTGVHVPMLFLFTNGGCGPCVQANEAMNTYMDTAGDAVALMRIHTWWPNGSDIMYTSNPEQCDTYINEYGVGGVPSFWLDGIHGLGSIGTDAVAACDESRLEFSPVTIAPSSWNSSLEQLMVTLDFAAELPAGGDYRLICCITEDDIFYEGGNGESIHHQAFRRAYPSTVGDPITADTGIYLHTLEMDLDDGWEFDRLRATCYLQDRNTRRIWQAGTRFLSEISGVSSVAETFFPNRILGNYPNPFNPETTITFSVTRSGPARVSVFDSQGRLVRVLLDGTVSAGEGDLSWDGRDHEGRSLSSGIYFVNLAVSGLTDSRKIVLLK